MPFDYVIYLMLFISFLYGLYQGVKRESSYLFSYSVSFALVFLWIGPSLKSIDFINSFLDKIKSFLDIIFEFMRINPNIINFLFIYILPFTIINLLINLILKKLFFRKEKHTKLNQKISQRLLGGILGVFVGIQLSVIALIIMNSIIVVDTSGGLSKIIVENVKFVSDIIKESACLA